MDERGDAKRERKGEGREWEIEETVTRERSSTVQLVGYIFINMCVCL